jgi:23S rRNA pseudouridine2605 synthase
VNAGDDPPPPRVQKHLADLGLGSRREIEAWILAGRVAADGRVLRLGERVPPAGVITVDGRPVVRAPLGPPRVLLYHKPPGELSTRRDPRGRPLVFDRLPPLDRGRWVMVGRLDYATEGLLVFTTEGFWAEALMHPRNAVPRRYAARVRDPLSEEEIDRLRAGVRLDDGRASCTELVALGGGGRNRWYGLVVREGRNRLVRRLFEAVGHPVGRLVRVGYGPLVLPPGLRRGQSAELAAGEVDALRDWLAALPAPPPAAAPRPRTAGLSSGRAPRPR